MKSVGSLAAMLVLSSLGCSNADRVSKAIGYKVRAQQSQEIRLADATDFEWESVYLFEPYTPRAKVCDALGIQVKYCERFVPYESKDDGVMSMAFVSGNRVVHYELHTRWNGDFTPLPPKQPISAANAIFRVVPEGTAADGTAWLKLVLK